ncbi:SEC-C metal-binding domain-containing protein [Psychromonas sp. psych-6C06]|nr:SEC-C metal-binding domain-containing protein [Psychromonas sp. psych-6C06]
MRGSGKKFKKCCANH